MHVLPEIEANWGRTTSGGSGTSEQAGQRAPNSKWAFPRNLGLSRRKTGRMVPVRCRGRASKDRRWERLQEGGKAVGGCKALEDYLFLRRQGVPGQRGCKTGASLGPRLDSKSGWRDCRSVSRGVWEDGERVRVALLRYPFHVSTGTFHDDCALRH